MLKFILPLAASAVFLSNTAAADCPDYTVYSASYHAPFSSGRYNLSSQRPAVECRTFISQDVEDVITTMSSTITDPDLRQLFTNSFPNTLDTAIKWQGYANGTDEELTFIITGDINAMWLRDSSNQLQSYLSLLKPSTSQDSLASLYRGAINLQARYLLISPHCNAFQAPVEAGLDVVVNTYALTDISTPVYSNQSVFECKYELDSLAAFLQVSVDYYSATKDSAFFAKYSWVAAMEALLNTAEGMMIGTYSTNGSVNTSPYTFKRTTNSSPETQSNKGQGNPVASGTGLIRSAYRPSDDSTTYQLFIPANMMFSTYLAKAALIATAINETTLARRMSSLAAGVKAAVKKHGIASHPVHGRVYAYEVDGFGNANFMDDANIPSLLSAPFLGFLDAGDSVYKSTRRLVLGENNPYWQRGSVINTVGTPHSAPGKGWPMASIMRILTSSNSSEISSTLREILSSTAGLGLIHEGINTFNASTYSRPWFSWANGLFGQMIIDLAEREPTLVGQSFQ